MDDEFRQGARAVSGRSLPFREQLALESAIEDAFAPLAERTSSTSAARVRAAARWRTHGEGALAGATWAGLVRRVVESCVAVAAAAPLLVSAAGVDNREIRPPSVIEEYFRARPPADDVNYLRWLRLTDRGSSSVHLNLPGDTDHTTFLDR